MKIGEVIISWMRAESRPSQRTRILTAR
ncbi:hypothetical protein N7535_003132 [Penicillium sp. DV-2018c]|nr:hypothetical protein N7461_001176 [Penicillium sp. DV-2018c]KAJ5576206.1 hypothetical protein N7535_003132 [Penicillium sp. DV-2018c]